ncbi:MAG: accessory gene regulator B family protein [Sedimentibacter sp.]|uniref:accessory gene regulator ArgB-like protein n=1 Tax=Sedimentibacter sp. TaxID=1960295 RepID=UPI003158BE59
MIESLSISITDFFYSNDIIEEDEKEILVYGLQLIISSLLGVSVLLMIGAALGRLTDTIIFLVTFIILRMYSGGYHANSYLKCNITLISVYMGMIGAVTYTPPGYSGILSFIMAAYTVCMVLRYAPVDNENKRLDEKKKKENRTVTVVLMIAFYLIAMVMYKTGVQSFYTVIVTMFSVAVLIKIKVKGSCK